MSVNHPFAGPISWVHPMPRRPPLLEVWHWSWLDLSWTTPLSWWQAWDPAAIPVGGSDWHRPGSDAPLGTPTTWVLCADASVAGVLDGLRAGRVAISASRDGRGAAAAGGLSASRWGRTAWCSPGPRARTSGYPVTWSGCPGAAGLPPAADPDGRDAWP